MSAVEDDTPSDGGPTIVPPRPFWSAEVKDRYPGRFPLSVERHVFRQVDRLATGVTTVTPHARYYLLHTLVAAEAREQGLAAGEWIDLLRRAEVVMAGVASLHADPHPGLARAHGAAVISDHLNAAGLDVAGAAAPGVYAKAKRGFLGPYLGSELALRLLEIDGGAPAVGPAADIPAIREALGQILILARRNRLSVQELEGARDLCLCGSVTGPDGALLRQLLLASRAQPGTYQGNRRGTIRMLARLIDLHPPNRVMELAPFLAFDDRAQHDPGLLSLDVTRAWQGTVLRWYAVNAWRQLWAWLVNDHINGLTTRDDLADALADQLPVQSVQSFLDALPPAMIDDHPAPAELQVGDRAMGERQFAVTALSALRAWTMPTDLLGQYEDPREANQQLTPTWMADFLDRHRDRHVRDAGRDLVQILIDRSQRLALRKAAFQRQVGYYRFPTRVFTRDSLVFRDSSEGSAPVGLRWDQAVTVLAEVGLFQRQPDRWALTDLGRELV